MTKKAILLIVEGAKTEKEFFSRMLNLYGMDYDIICFQTNIYKLYKILKAQDFNCDIKGILKEEIINDRASGEIKKLDSKFAYTYLIFDCDIHHDSIYKKEGSNCLSREEMYYQHLSEIKEMVEFFKDETDPTIGKLYVNYPMMEAYKDCESFVDEKFIYNDFPVADLSKYKEHIGKRKIGSNRIDKYEKNDFENIIKLNLEKAENITNGHIVKYSQYMNTVSGVNILSKETEYVKKYKKIKVLNTSVLLLVDYYGNQNSFYDDLIKDMKPR